MTSRENAAIDAYLTAAGVAHRITSTTTGVHAPNSYHFRPGTDGVGLASDIAGLRAGDATALRAIFNAFSPVANQLAELIYYDPAGGITRQVKHGQWVAAYDTAPDSRNHVHVAVERGTFISLPTQEPQMASLQDILSVVNFTKDQLIPELFNKTMAKLEDVNDNIRFVKDTQIPNIEARLKALEDK